MQPQPRRDRPRTGPRRLVACLAVGTAAFAGAVACTDDSPGGSADRTPAAPLTSDQLKTALLTTADFTDGTTVTPSDHRDSETPATDNPLCRPVMDLLGVQATEGTPVGTAVGMIGTAKGGAEVVVMLLASFPNGYAAQLLGQGIAALPMCASFTGTTKAGGKVEYAAVGLPGPTYGDESVAVKLVTKADGQQVTAQYIVARVGDTLVDLAMADTTGGPGRLPDAALVTKQIDKLQAVK